MISKEKDKKISKANYFLNTYFKYVSIILIGVILIAGMWLILWPRYSDIQHQNNNRVPELRNELDSKESYYAKLKKLTDQLDILNKDSNARELQKINNILPDKANVQSLFVEIEHLISAEGFQLQKIAINEVKTDLSNLVEFQVEEFMSLNEFPDSLRAVDIEVTVEGGGYSDFKNLVKRIEDNERLFNLVTINFSALSEPSYVDKEGTEFAEKQYSFDFRTYYLEQDDAL